MTTFSNEEAKALSHVLKSYKQILSSMLNVPLPKKQRLNFMKSIDCLNSFIARIDSAQDSEVTDREDL